MKCPNCGLINPPSALRCDCGYDFPSGLIKESYLSETRNLKTSQSTSPLDIVDEKMEVDASVSESEKASVWIPWYFHRKGYTLLTGALFIGLILHLTDRIYVSVIQGFAMLRASAAVFGFWGALIALSVGPGLLLIPPAITYSLLKGLPGLWRRPDASRLAKLSWTLILLVALPSVGEGVARGSGHLIRWIADQKPCAAIAAGVTSSKVPVDCK
jgi:hypothetical protein